MANNPYVNKVVYGNSTVMDISDTTAEEADVENGKVFYKGNGQRSTGTGSMSGAVWGNITGDLSDQTDLAEALDAKAGTSMLRDSLGYLPQDFIPDEYEFTEETINGVTFKAESDGTITLSGRATATTTLVIAQNIPLGRANYTFKYILNLQETEKTTGYVDSSKIRLVVSKTGNSASVNLGDIYQYNVSSSASGNYTVSLVVESGTNLTSGVYNVYPAILWDKPLIYDVAPASKKTDSVMSAEIEDDDFIPVYDSSSSDVGGVKKSWYYIKNKLLSDAITPTPSDSVTEASVVDAVNGAISEGGENKEIPNLYGIGKWSNTMTKKYFVQGIAGSSTPIGKSGIGNWCVDGSDETGWISIPELIGIGSKDHSINITYDPSKSGIIIRGGYVIDDTTGKMCIKFANEISEADTHTAKIGIEITINRTESNPVSWSN